MAISKKGKRTFVDNDTTYYWYIGESEYFAGMSSPVLHIMSHDKKIVLKYQINQVFARYRTHLKFSPTIFVEKSDKLLRGRYNFFPPINDETITQKSVSKIIKWYDRQETDAERLIQLNYNENIFLQIDYQDGKVIYYEEFDRKFKQEDLLLVEYPNGCLLHLGWYGQGTLGDRSCYDYKNFVLYVVKNDDWHHPLLHYPLLLCSSNDQSELKWIIEDAIDKISTL